MLLRDKEESFLPGWLTNYILRFSSSNVCTTNTNTDPHHLWRGSVRSEASTVKAALACYNTTGHVYCTEPHTETICSTKYREPVKLLDWE